MPFTIIKQLDPDYGCIPACALSVLRSLGVQPLPSEAELLTAMRSPPGSGFQKLRDALEALVPGVKAEIITLEDFLAQRSRHDDLVLLAHKSGSKAHCVVVSAVTDGSATVHDPAASQPDIRTETLGWVSAEGTGDCLVLRTV